MDTDTTLRDLVAALTSLLDLEPGGDDRFRAPPTPDRLQNGVGRLYGGQVIAQSFAAAALTVPDDRLPHSLHAYFLRMGDDAAPIDFEVSRDLDGGSFSNRHVCAKQGERTILSISASFHRREDSVSHQDAMPDVPAPETLTSDVERRRILAREQGIAVPHGMIAPRPFDQRTCGSVEWMDPKEPAPPELFTWVRTAAPVGNDPRLHCALLAYASDLMLLPTATLPHALSWFRGEMREASLDHAVWFHDDFRIDEWLLFATHSPWAGRARGLINGKVFRQDGTLVASVMQEGMIRTAPRS